MEWINNSGPHHPRKGKHSDAFSEFIVEDLYTASKSIRNAFQNGTLAYDLNVPVATKAGKRGSAEATENDIDLALGKPQKATKTKSAGPLRAALKSGALRVLVEHKTITTAHRNAHNRLNDMDKFAKHAFETNPRLVVAGTVLLGTTLTYLSVEEIDRILSGFKHLTTIPYWTKRLGQAANSAPELSKDYWHKKMFTSDAELLEAWGETNAMKRNKPRDVESSFQIFVDGIPLRHSITKIGYDAFLLAPVHIDNIAPCRLDDDGFPDRRDQMTYDRFLKSIVKSYESRFA